MTLRTLCTAALVLLAATPLLAGDKLWVYFGTYTGPKSKGIYRSDFDIATGKLSPPELVGETANPSFIAIHPSRQYLYAVNEIGSFQDKKQGAVTAFRIDGKTGQLTLLNQQGCGGTGPCHITLDRDGKHALVANYGGGSAAVLPIESSGQLAPMSSFQQHVGSGPLPRQAAPHAHSINLDAANKFAVVADLGLDKVLIYQYDAAKGTITPNEPAAGTVPPGSGPRHFAFHPNGKLAYVINEITLTVTVFDYDATHGALTQKQTLSTLPEGATGKGFSTAEVVVHPGGKFLYGSNRGHDSLAIFKIADDGTLTAAGHRSGEIKTPRNFAIEPSGKFLFVANQSGNSVVVYRIDSQSGALEPTGSTIEVGAPVCVRFLAP